MVVPAINRTLQPGFALGVQRSEARHAIGPVGLRAEQGFLHPLKLRLQFDRRGTWLLEQYSTANLGKHFAIFSQFPSPPDAKLNQGRWLAAPRINQRIPDGVLTFAPDATREEAEQIVLGLNNVAKQLKKGSE